ncbi:hypothetical protein BB934_45420 (plasmid) [Microvirga ossetica]|uniref:Uncharacterized protein n=1 Tax=Microvirga ossetica TaxID=1882682 RepID=A0A1B2EZV4_9HYPH|nr:hypothetical protein [Microvirga ossetica]ANY85462.1 hypothetical protein BB934_45420 [Microvirga ossetica]
MSNDTNNGVTIIEIDYTEIVHVNGKPTNLGFQPLFNIWTRCESSIGGWIRGSGRNNEIRDRMGYLAEIGFAEKVRAARAAGSAEFEMKESVFPAYSELDSVRLHWKEVDALLPRCSKKQSRVEFQHPWGSTYTNLHWAVLLDGIETGFSYYRRNSYDQWELYVKDENGYGVKVQRGQCHAVKGGIHQLVGLGMISKVLAAREAAKNAA